MQKAIFLLGFVVLCLSFWCFDGVSERGLLSDSVVFCWNFGGRLDFIGPVGTSQIVPFDCQIESVWFSLQERGIASSTKIQVTYSEHAHLKPGESEYFRPLEVEPGLYLPQNQPEILGAVFEQNQSGLQRSLVPDFRRLLRGTLLTLRVESYATNASNLTVVLQCRRIR